MLTALLILKRAGGFIAEHWQIIGVLILIGIIGWERGTIKRLNARVIEAERATDLANAQLDTCHSVMTDLKARSEVQEARLKEATDSANQAALASGKAAQAWLHAPVPKECAGAIQWQAVNGRKFADDWEAGR